MKPRIIMLILLKRRTPSETSRLLFQKAAANYIAVFECITNSLRLSFYPQMTQSLAILMKYKVTHKFGLRLWGIVDKFILNESIHSTKSGKEFKDEIVTTVKSPILILTSVLDPKGENYSKDEKVTEQAQRYLQNLLNFFEKNMDPSKKLSCIEFTKNFVQEDFIKRSKLYKLPLVSSQRASFQNRRFLREYCNAHIQVQEISLIKNY